MREWLAVVVVLMLITVAAARSQWLWRLDQSLYDISLTLWERPAAQDIVIVAIDDASLDAIGRWPWRRAIHATLTERIAVDQPRALALDIILSEADNEGGDILLAERLRSVTSVLPLVIESGAGAAREVPPVAVLASAATRQGLIGLELDRDGLARSVYLREGIGKARHPQLALAMLEAAGLRSAAAELPGEADPEGGARWSRSRMRDHWYHVPFVGPPGAYSQVSYSDVLAGQMPSGFFRDKFVFVGATAIGLGDAFPTPVSGGSRPLPGVEIHANVLQALNEGIDIRMGGPSRAAWLGVLALLISMALFLRLSPRQGLVLTGVSALTLLLGAALLLRVGQVWIAPSAALLAVLSAYPIWSWRRLEAAQGYLTEEFERLSAEPALIPGGTESYRVTSGSAVGINMVEGIEKRMESLREATERLRNLKRFVTDALDSLPDATMVVDREGCVVLANIRMMSLAGVADSHTLAGRPVTAVLTGVELKNADWKHVHEALSAGDTLSLEAAKQDGSSEREYLLHTSPCHAASGERIGGILALIDVSTLKETERARDEVLRFLSHDMRAPQASILTLLEMHAIEPAAMPVGKLTDRVGRYAKRTLTLADDFLRLARAERARTAEFTAVDLVALLEEVRDEAMELARSRDTMLELDVGVEEALVNGDGELLRRAVMNLVSNAIKYSPQGKRVCLGLAADPIAENQPGWSIFVTDQGHGIASEDLPRLFGRFKRFRREGQPEEDGIGLGLVFVKTVAERHGGSVDVFSRTEPADQCGSTFTLKLPAQS